MDLTLGSFIILLAVTGYLSLNQGGYTRYKIQHLSGYHLVYASVIRGILLMGLAMIPAASIFYVLDRSFFPDTRKEVLLVWALSFLLALGFPLLKTPEQLRADILRAAKDLGNYLELLLETAQMEGSLVELFLENNKAYIGFVFESGIDSEGGAADISIVPVLSGYRTQDTRKLIISYDYSKVIQSILASDKKNFRIVIPIRKIEIARIVTLEQFKYHVDDELEVIDVPPEEKATGSIRAAPGNA